MIAWANSFAKGIAHGAGIASGLWLADANIIVQLGGW